MKTLLISLTGALVTALLLSSCNGNLHVEKRHYRSGFYTGFSHSDKDDHTEPAAPKDKPDNLVYIGQEPEESDSEDTIAQVKEFCPLAKDSVHATALHASSPGLIAPEVATRDTVKPQKQHKKILRYNGPPETRKAAELYRVGMVLMAIGLLLGVLGFLPFFPYAGILAFTFFAGVVVEIVAIIVASEGVGKYEGKDPALENAFREIRRKAMWILLGAYILRLLLLFGRYATEFFLGVY